jgi:hypothetical protein
MLERMPSDFLAARSFSINAKDAKYSKNVISCVLVYRFANGNIEHANLRDLGIPLPLWAINVWWLLTFAKGFLLLRDNRWRKATRWMHFISDLLAAAILCWVTQMVTAAIRRPAFAEAIGSRGLAEIFVRFVPTTLLLLVLILLVISILRFVRLLRTERLAHPV